MNTQKILLLVFFLLAIPFAGTCKFIRVYDREGALISKGVFALVNDSALKLYHQGSPVYIRSERIGHIVTGRTEGHNIGISALVGGLFGSIVGLATSNPDVAFGYTAAEGAGGGMLIGGAGGAFVGFITIFFKSHEIYTINGSKDALQQFHMSMKNKPESLQADRVLK